MVDEGFAPFAFLVGVFLGGEMGGVENLLNGFHVY
jgi:hypothetical protein